MKKNRQFVMFVIMLIMMTMMATLATRQFPQTTLVEFFLEYESNEPIPNRFSVQNITDDRLTFTKRYEVWQLHYGEDEAILVYETKLDEIFYVDSGEFYVFSYDFSANAPKFIHAELAPGIYSLTKFYTFYGQEREHVISVGGHMFIIRP